MWPGRSSSTRLIRRRLILSGFDEELRLNAEKGGLGFPFLCLRSRTSRIYAARWNENSLLGTSVLMNP
ncbi:hypothetical protein BN126350068 [Stenotrophomonas maltophilia]|nr:hypothetical protein BN126350068 [Stenotrophomonas maltophilia]